MSDFLEIVFPEDLSERFEGGPVYRTYVNQADSAYEQRIQGWDEPQYEYSVDLLMLYDYEIEALLNFFHIVKGKKYGFRFKDYMDHSVSNQVIGTVTSAPATLQAIKSYEVETYQWNREIKKLVQGTVHVYVDGTEVSATVDYNTGEITVNQTGTVTYSGEFHVPCRFDTDKFAGRLDSKKIITSPIVIRSIKL